MRSILVISGALTSLSLLLAGEPAPSQREHEHWAFRPVHRTSPPPVSRRTWPQTIIDHFILASLERAGASPAPPAERSVFLRRVTFDLIGLPPTPEEIDAFLRDTSPEAYERVIERLLASPHYGERWGRHWLDVARYADTKGYVFFEEKEYPWAYTYRDYVLRAFNDNLPFDRFIIEQLAADLVVGQTETPSRGRDALPALGFLTLGGRFMNNTPDILDDRIDVVTRGLMGLTVSCARCHDHKFDPVSTKDYYGLYGVFANTVEPTVPPLFAEPARTPQYEAFEKELQKRERYYSVFVQARHAEVTRGAITRMQDYLLAARELRDRPRSDDFMFISDPGDLNPTMTLRWKAYLDRARKSRDPVFVAWHALADLSGEAFAERAAGVLAALEERSHPLVLRALQENPPKSLEETAQRYAELLNRIENADRRRLALPMLLKALGLCPSTVASDPPVQRDAATDSLREVVHGPDSPPNWPLHTIDDLALFPDRAGQGKLQELRKAVEEWRIKGPGAPPRAMSVEDAARIREARVFVRGNPNILGATAQRQLPEFLTAGKPAPFPRGSGRLELARAIVDPENRLTARVTVNRIWLHHFGQGLVRTPSDFGLRSEPPTHPELLDWLAAEFVGSGWSVKHIHRLILRSAVYQQSSEGNPGDPENRHLARMNRRRLDFESTRDALLAVSGRLDRSVGGPPMRDLLGPDANRRTVYAHLDRLNLPGIYRTFDFPSPDATSPQRDATTVAPQALFWMNNPFVADCAKRMLQRPDVLLTTEVDQRIARLYALAFGRTPRASEHSLALSFLGPAPALADWERYVQALLIANEFVFVE